MRVFEHYLVDPETSLDSLTIGRLSKVVKIHRVTFYNHFLSMNDFIKWFLHKDLIFQLNTNDGLTIEVSLKMIFEFINDKRPTLQKILNSSYGRESQAFITEETMTYQLTNMTRIDTLQRLSQVERRVYTRFYSQAIQLLILDYIVDDVVQSFSVGEHLTYCVFLIKNYIEKLIEAKAI